ncbi:ATP-dependent DNA helicase [Actinomyces howellii]|uniref:DNA 3'-5' helicase n=1 Tax=Actinomyces howellii TaxID=52771 RepID=A0A3S4RVV6_9ACTO|nr:ATP-dependent DNA helicase [Actinomyces howellii]VEG27143.1 ATP-dependent DNA helicase pcrA [Actinomyces howellii]
MSTAPTPQELASALGLHAPTDEQARVIAHRLSPLLVVAGAGSGKTATMSQRVVHLVARGAVRPDQVLGLTFTRKATAELAQRVSARLEALGSTGVLEADPDAPEPTIATYNSFAASLVRDHGLRIGIDPEATLITEARAWQIASEIVQARTDPLPVQTLSSAVAAVLRLDAALSENLLTIEQAARDLEDLTALFEGLAAVRGLKTALGQAPARTAERLGMLEAVAAFQERKRSHALITFGDQIALACRIAENVPEAAAQVRAQYPAVLLDEFQDTSVAQVRLLSALFAGSGVTAVGDPNQAIYGWRGASAGALDSFHTHFNPAGTAALDAGADPRQATPVLPLSTAWRNDLAVLEAANVVSAPLRHHVPAPGDAQVTHIPVEPLRPRPAEAGVARGQVHAAFTSDPLAEAEVVADFMAERWRPDAELAVLARVRSAFPVLAQALEARGIPYEIVGLGGMLTVPEVADVRALVTVAADPERGDRLMRLLTGAGLGATDLRALSAHARTLARGGARTPARAQEPEAGPAEAAGHAGPTGPAEAAGPAGPAGARTASDRSGEPGAGAREDTPLLAEAVDAVARHADAARDAAGTTGPAQRPRGGQPRAVEGLSPAGARAVDRIARAVRRVRGALTLALPDVLVLAEQALGLDVEVAARVGNPMGRRALDALRTIAEQYAADVPDATVVGFLTWLDVAADQENGLDAPVVEPEPGAVQLLTVHAAKGLEWDAVAVVGLSEKSFPSYSTEPRSDLSVSDSSWMTRLDEFPHPMRSDAATLPPFEIGALEPPNVDKEEVKVALADYRLALGRHGLAEERRLAYVAITRARHEVLLTGSHLTGTATKPRPMSRFLAELWRRDLLSPLGPGLTDLDPEAANPLAGHSLTATWPPPDPQDDMTRARRAAARAVSQASAHLPGQAHRPPTGTAAPRDATGPDDTDATGPDDTQVSDGPGQVGGPRPQAGEGAPPPGPTDPLVARWREETELLLAERARRRAERPTVVLPDHLAATKVDDLRADPDRFALDLRRPLPPQPRAAGRLGTVFHEALATRLAEQGELISLTEAGVPDSLSRRDRDRVERWLTTAEELPLLAGHVLTDTETELELTLAGTTLRCRLDAVFWNPATSTWLIVDWKTGRRRVPVDQLSVYVHAWAAAHGVGTQAVRAAYVYVDPPGGQVDELRAEALLSLDQIEALLRLENG